MKNYSKTLLFFITLLLFSSCKKQHKQNNKKINNKTKLTKKNTKNLTIKKQIKHNKINIGKTYLSEDTLTQNTCIEQFTCIPSFSEFTIKNSRKSSTIFSNKISNSNNSSPLEPTLFGDFIFKNNSKFLRYHIEQNTVVVKDGKQCVGFIAINSNIPTSCLKSKDLSIDISFLNTKQLKNLISELKSKENLYLSLKSSQMELLKSLKNNIKGFLVLDILKTNEKLESFKNLEYVYLISIAQKFSKNINLPNLKYVTVKSIDFPCSTVIPQLTSNLNNIKEVNLECKLSKKGIDILSEMKNLEVLHIKYAFDSSVLKSFAKLAKLRKIKEFSIETRKSISDLVQVIYAWNNLKGLTLNFNSSSDLSIEKLPKNLEYLILRGNLNNIKLNQLTNFKHLKYLVLNQRGRSKTPDLNLSELPKSLKHLEVSSLKLSNKIQAQLKSLSLANTEIPILFLQENSELQSLYIQPNSKFQTLNLPKTSTLKEIFIISYQNIELKNLKESLSNNCKIIKLIMPKIATNNLQKVLSNKNQLEQLAIISEKTTDFPILNLPSLRFLYLSLPNVKIEKLKTILNKSSYPNLNSTILYFTKSTTNLYIQAFGKSKTIFEFFSKNI